MNRHAYRLPRRAWPQQYDLALTAGWTPRSSPGRSPSTWILWSPAIFWMHARDLQVRDAVVTVGARTLPGTLALDPEREVCTLHFAEALPTGAATLTLAFQGQLNKALRGLYRAEDGPEQMLASQCEETDARCIFPCLDEPTSRRVSP